MKHHNSIRTLGRPRDQRKALLSSLAEALVLHGKILTTEARAKELRPYIERLVTRGKKGTLAARRDIIAILDGREVIAKKLVEEIAPRYKERPGGYTRITKVVKRSSDGRKSAVIEWVV